MCMVTIWLKRDKKEQEILISQNYLKYVIQLMALRWDF